MAKTTFILEADEANAVRGFLKLVDAQNKAEKKTKDINKTNKDAQKEVGGIGAAAQRMGQQVLAGLAAFASISTIKQGVRELIAELEKAAQLRQEMYQTALTVEDLTRKTAHLRGEVSQASLGRARADISQIAGAAKVPYDVASKILFFSESAMGPTPAAQASAETISQFSGAAGLTPEEVRNIPKVFSILQANTKEQQLEVLNQIYRATASSIAETGEYIQPFISTMVSDITRGFTLEQSLARMTAAVEATGSVEEAATVSRQIAAIASGRTEKGVSFLQDEYIRQQAEQLGVDLVYEKSKKKGFASRSEKELDIAATEEAISAAGGRRFGEFTDPERFEFARQIYKQYKEQNRLDELKTTMGGRMGYEAMLAIFGPVGERKYYEMLSQIEAAKGADTVQQMFGQYQGTLGAKEIEHKLAAQMGQAVTGEQKAPQVMLEEITAEALKQTKALATGWGEHIGFALSPGRYESHWQAQNVLLENLALALEQSEKDSAEYQQIMDLMQQVEEAKSFRVNQKLVEEAYGVTGGFQMIGQAGRLASEETMLEFYRTLPPIIGKTRIPGEEELRLKTREADKYMRGIGQYYGLNESQASGGADMNVLTEAINKNTEAVKQNTEAAQKRGGNYVPVNLATND